MNVEECKLKDGVYSLLECKDYKEFFELTVEKGKCTFIKVIIFPFSIIEIPDKDYSVLCDIHESDDWFDNKDEVIEEISQNEIFKSRLKR